MKLRLCFSLVGIYLLVGCKPQPSEGGEQAGGLLPNSYARGFQLAEIDEGYSLTVMHPADTTKVLAEYVFSRTRPSSARHNVIHIPVKSVSVYSTTFLPYFRHLQSEEVVTGIANANLVMNPLYRKRLKEGLAVNITRVNEPDLERLIALQNDVFMVYPYADNDFSRYKQAGIPVVYNLEYQEEHPLARVEWIKLAGVLLDKFSEAKQNCEEVFEAYTSFSQTIPDSAVSVFTGSYYGGMWYAPPANSYLAHLITDAGGHYIFQERKTDGNIALDFEAALDRFSDLDFWGIIISHEGRFDLEAVSKMDARYRHLRSFQTGQIFYCNTHNSDYFGAAVMEPQVILKDLAAIFYPELYANHQPVYFRSIQEADSL